MTTRKRPVFFAFDDGPTYLGYTDGTTWNGWANVWVDPDTNESNLDDVRRICKKIGQDEKEGLGGMDEIAPDDDGLICYAYGFTASILPALTYSDDPARGAARGGVLIPNHTLGLGAGDVADVVCDALGMLADNETEKAEDERFVGGQSMDDFSDVVENIRRGLAIDPLSLGIIWLACDIYAEGTEDSDFPAEKNRGRAMAVLADALRTLSPQETS